MILKVEHKKGDPKHLDGRVTVYAKIEIEPEELISMKHPFASMVHNGLIATQGNYREQYSLKDFLKKEIGISFDSNSMEEISEFIERLGGIEAALDPEKLKERLDNLGEFEEIIPTPAKVVPFNSEDEILSQEGDVFYAGSFKNIGNALMSINAVPMLYQAYFREQEIQHIRNEIESIIAQIEHNDDEVDENLRSLDVEERLMKDFFPKLLYCRKEKGSFENIVKKLYNFLKGYRFKSDIDSIIKIIIENEVLHPREDRLLELYAKKIAAVIREDFQAAEEYTQLINELSKENEGKNSKT
ncbi:MAG: hypothetical protein N2053_06010 [Chitinispirillaceae bacterium]|nr:hypothetical protein [Chitinispirillaceae bacterium]